MLRKVQISLRIKIGVCSLMGLGVLSVTVPQRRQRAKHVVANVSGHKYGGSLHRPDGPQLAERQ